MMTKWIQEGVYMGVLSVCQPNCVQVSEYVQLQTPLPLQGLGSSNPTDMMHILPILKPAPY